jgi:hypothetical protein
MKNRSSYALLISIVFIIVFRFSHTTNDREIAWDILGYYMPLPASFIHHDPLLKDIDWLKKVNEEKDLTGTLYMISSNDKGEPMYFFFFGMAIFYLPFFFIGHLFAMLGGFPMDGFSMPYQYSMVLGAVLYTIIGLIYFRKVLRNFFSENITAIVLLTTVFATNYAHHLTLKDLETVNVLFMLVSIIVWFTIEWHKNQKRKYLYFIASAIALIALVKPSEIVVILIPLLWNINSWKALKEKFIMIKNNWIGILIAALIALIIVSPQLIYWYIKTGHIYYDTYKNPGVGLDFKHPHILESLFSFRKGWLIYTPVIIFYIWGQILMFRRNNKAFYAVNIYLLVTFYIIVSWSEWWYGAGFSNRPIITAYPVLAIGFGYFLEYIETKNRIWKSSFAVILVLFTLLNQFQWWQLRNNILDPYRTTKEYYFATFLKTSVTDSDRELLLVKRDFSGLMEFNNREKYEPKVVFSDGFDTINNASKTSGNPYLIASNQDEFVYTQKIEYSSMTNRDHIWVNIRFKYRSKNCKKDQFPLLVVTMDRKQGNYGYRTFNINNDKDPTQWIDYSFDYLTPEIRERNDELLIYFWNWRKNDFDIDDFTITVYEKKPLRTL